MSAVVPALRPVIRVVVALFNLLIKPQWQGVEKLPRGGSIVVVNHISNVDPMVIGAFLVRHRILPRFLAKQSLFAAPVLGSLLRGAGQIPVHRQTSVAGDALDTAAAVIAEGGCVVIYPEGTITDDPQLWPKPAKTGAARLALRTGCPVIPVGQWGAEQILYGKQLGVPRFLPRKRISVLVGDPVDLSDLDPDRPAAITEAGRRMTRAITELVAELRGEPAPVAYDPGRTTEGSDRSGGTGTGERADREHSSEQGE